MLDTFSDVSGMKKAGLVTYGAALTLSSKLPSQSA